MLLDRDDLVRAELILREVVQGRQRVHGSEHPFTLDSVQNLAMARLAEGRSAEAESSLRQVLEARTRLFGPDHVSTLNCRLFLAGTFVRQGRLSGAEDLLRDLLRTCRLRLGAVHPETLYVQFALADVWHRQGRYAEAEPLFKGALTAALLVAARSSTALAVARVALGRNYLKRGQPAAAEGLLREALASFQKARPGCPPRFEVQSMLGEALTGQGEYDSAEPLVLSGYEGLAACSDRTLPDLQQWRSEAAGRIVRLYEAWDKPRQAAAWKKKLGWADLPADIFAPPPGADAGRAELTRSVDLCLMSPIIHGSTIDDLDH